MSITPTGLCPQPIGKPRKQGQPILVLHQASVAHLGVAQHLLDIEKGCSTFALTLAFHGSSNCSSWSLPNLFDFDGPIAMGQPPCDPHGLGPSPLPQPRASSLWRSFSEGFSAWMLVGSSDGQTMHQAALTIPHVELHAKAPLVPFPGLLHLGITFSRPVLPRCWRCSDAGIRNPPFLQHQTLTNQMLLTS